MKQHISRDIFQSFTGFFNKHPLPPGHSLLLAVSGGIDSIVLCHLCKQAGFNFSIAHCNFNLRGEESLRDENFVRGIGGGVPVFIKHFDTERIAQENKQSIQETARKLRYEWFEQLQKENGFDFILTAHHADDNIETMLMHFFRGTGLRGLTGIPAMNGKLLRPLLEVRRSEIENYAGQHQLKWVEDQSNSSSKYTRNFFRNDLLPAIREKFPNVDENLFQNLDRFQKTYSFYEEQVAKELKSLVERNGTEIKIPVRKLKKSSPEILLFELTRPFGFSSGQLQDIIGLMDSTSGKFVRSETHQVIRHGLWLVIAPVSTDSALITIDESENEIKFSKGNLLFKKGSAADFKISNDENLALLDAKHISYPLVLRRWKQGDYFYPLGMRKKKKIARFLIDKKVAKHLKEDTWVLESGKKILWVVGMRIDDRFKLGPSTSSVLSITYQH